MFRKKKKHKKNKSSAKSYCETKINKKNMVLIQSLMHYIDVKDNGITVLKI